MDFTYNASQPAGARSVKRRELVLANTSLCFALRHPLTQRAAGAKTGTGLSRVEQVAVAVPLLHKLFALRSLRSKSVVHMVRFGASSRQLLWERQAGGGGR